MWCMLILALVLAGCGSEVMQTQLALNLKPGYCSVNEVQTSWLGRNVYAVCEDNLGNVIVPMPGVATSPGQALVNTFATLGGLGVVLGAAGQIH